MNTVAYRLIPNKLKKVEEDIDRFLNYLKNAEYDVRQKQNKVEFSIKNNELTAELIFPKSKEMYENDYDLPSQEIIFTCQSVDDASINAIKLVAEKLDYRVFSEEISSFLPKNLYILFTKSNLARESDELFQSQGLKPMFYDSYSGVTYARSFTDGSMHIINSALHRYFLDFGPFEKRVEEFSYKVAENLEEFVAFSDKFLIPTSFYKYYKKPLKVLNDSDFEINRIDRKVFVKPLIWELDSDKKEFFLLSKEGSSLVFMDKIRPRETLETTLRRILKDELKISSDFIRARVLPDLEFDRDRDDNLTPRLVVAVFVDKIEKTTDIERKAKRSWNPVD